MQCIYLTEQWGELSFGEVLNAGKTDSMLELLQHACAICTIVRYKFGFLYEALGLPCGAASC